MQNMDSEEITEKKSPGPSEEITDFNLMEKICIANMQNMESEGHFTITLEEEICLADMQNMENMESEEIANIAVNKQNIESEEITNIAIKQEIESSTCRICKSSLDGPGVVKIGEKGLKNLIITSRLREDNLFSETETEADNLILHTRCWFSYTNDKKTAAVIKRNNPNFFRSRQKKIFDFKNNCFLCGKDASEEFIKKQISKPSNRRIYVCIVTKPQTKESLLEKSCIYNLKWDQEVRKRIENEDLVSLKARYHRDCYTKFTLKSKPSSRKRGRPKSSNTTDHACQPLLNLTDIESHLDDNHVTNQDFSDPLSMELSSTQISKLRVREDSTVKRKCEDMASESTANSFRKYKDKVDDDKNECTQEIIIEVKQDENQLQSKDVTLDICMSDETDTTTNLPLTIQNVKKVKNRSSQTNHDQSKHTKLVMDTGKFLAKHVFPEQQMKQEKFIKAYSKSVAALIDLLE